MRNKNIPLRPTALTAMLGIAAVCGLTVVAVLHSEASVPAPTSMTATPTALPAPSAWQAPANDPKLTGYTPSRFPGVYVRQVPGAANRGAATSSMAAMIGAKVSQYHGNAQRRKSSVITRLPDGTLQAHVGTSFAVNETASLIPRSAHATMLNSSTR